MKFLTVLLLAVPLSLLGQSTIVKDVQLLDVQTQTIRENISVKITDGLIEKIAPFKRLKVANTDTIIEAAGQYLAPGLIDTHIHFFQSGSLYTRPDALDFTSRVPYQDEIQFAKDNATDYLQRYLKAGITTVMDVGGPMWNYTVRDSLAAKLNGPNVLVTGPLFSMVSRPQLDKGDPPIINMESKEDVLALFNEQLSYKPDFIKVWYVVTQDRPAESTYPLVEYLAELCRANNLKLAVHSTQLKTAKLAVKAGANILVHSVDDTAVDQEFINQLKEKEVTYIPTLTVSKGYYKAFTGKINHNQYDLALANPAAYYTLTDLERIEKEEWPAFLGKMYGVDPAPFLAPKDKIMFGNLMALSKAGVNIATGTDAGNIGTMHASSYMPEIFAMSEAGLSNWQILASSTLNAARGFGIDNTTGSIKEGLQADLILLDSNPIEDIKNLNSVAMVFKDGKAMQANTILEETPEQIVQRQVNAYNARDIEAFLDTYSEDIKVYGDDGSLRVTNLAQMRESYAGMFEQVTNLYCNIENRIVLGNKVIDKEKVRFGERYSHVVAVYEVKNGKIIKVNFIR